MRLNGVFYEYTKDVRTNAVLLEKYIKSKWFTGREAARDSLLRELLKSDAPFLAANNPEARIRFYPAWNSNLRMFAFAKPTYLITLMPRRYVVGIDQAKHFDIRTLQAWARNELLGFDYVGIVEAAHYSEARFGPDAGAQISFHVHLIVVGPDFALLERRIAEISRKYPSLIVSCNSADARLIKPEDLGLVFKYLIKEPTNDYRIYPIKEQIEDELGTTRTFDTDESRQRKKRLTSGVQLRVRRITRDWYLDKMIIGGGRGSAVLEKIRTDALRGLPWPKRKGRQNEFSGCFEYDGYQPGPRRPGSWVGVDGYIPEEKRCAARRNAGFKACA